MKRRDSVMKAHRPLVIVSLIFASCSQDDRSPDPTEKTGIGVLANPHAAEQEVADISANGPLTEAPVGFDGLTNGYSTQAQFIADEAIFEQVETIADGLGPVYNAQSCRECHQNPVTGAGSQVTEFRAGHFNGTNFVDHPGGSLLNDRAIDPAIQERIVAGQEVRTFRISLSLMGDGFVEAICSCTLQDIANAQPTAQRGTVIAVPVLEAPGNSRTGRFGWKNQHASLKSFAADAYLNEMGITSPLQPTENTSNGASVAAFDTVADPEDSGPDIDAFTRFMRSLKAPPRDEAAAATASAKNGAALFTQIGCNVCHVATINTAPTGSEINGGAFIVPAALGDKIIHPYSDFLLHDIGTGDGIVQNGGQGTRNQIRTAALWGMRSRGRLMHDGASVNRTEAINRHHNQAQAANNNFNALSATQQNDIVNFLNSL